MQWHRLSTTCYSVICCLIVLLAAAAAAAVTADQNAVNSNCGKSNTDKVDDIPVAEESSSTNFSITVGWAPAGYDFTKPYNYILECADCMAGIVNTTQRVHQFNNLPSATAYDMSIRAELSGCQPSNTLHFVARTRLAYLRGTVSITDVTQTTLRASWTPSIDVGVIYEVSWNHGSKNVTSNSTVCDGLTSGSVVTVTVRAFKDGFPHPTLIIHNTTLTKLFAVDASSAQVSTTASSISVSWTASKTDGVSYKLTCSGAAGNMYNSTGDTSANCQPLESGQPYNVTVTVQKAVEYEDSTTHLGLHLTKPTLSTENSNFNMSVTVADNGDKSTAAAASAAVHLTVKWTDAAATGADVMLVTVTSELNSELSVTSNGSFTDHDLWVTGPWFFSQKLTVTVTAVADKAGLTAHSQDKFVASKTTPPNRPSAMLTPDRRSISVTLTATSGSESLHASMNGSTGMMECSPAAPGDSCSVTFISLTPFTKYSVETWAEFQNLTSQLTHQEFRTLEAPSGMVRYLRVSQSESLETAMVEFEEPDMKNGLLMAYAVQLFEAIPGGACLQLVLLNVTAPESCQLVQCNTTLLIDKLSSECGHRVTTEQQQQQQLMRTAIAGLQPQTGYRVRVTPLSQTLPGNWTELDFGSPSVSGGSWVTIVVAVVVSVVVVATLCILVLVLLRYYPRILSRRGGNEPRAQQNSRESNGKSGVSHGVNRIDEYVMN